MIKPSIGRVVLVYRGELHEGAQWNTAQICYVYSDTQIRVAGSTRDGESFSNTLELRQDDVAKDAVSLPDGLIDGPDREQPFACWMPYQRKAAGV